MPRSLIALTALLGIAIALALWETRYTYLALPPETPFRGVAYAMRVNRYTGHVQVFIPEAQWLDLSASEHRDSTKR